MSESLNQGLGFPPLLVLPEILLQLDPRHPREGLVPAGREEGKEGQLKELVKKLLKKWLKRLLLKILTCLLVNLLKKWQAKIPSTYMMKLKKHK